MEEEERAGSQQPFCSPATLAMPWTFFMPHNSFTELRRDIYAANEKEKAGNVSLLTFFFQVLLRRN